MTIAKHIGPSKSKVRPIRRASTRAVQASKPATHQYPPSNLYAATGAVKVNMAARQLGLSTAQLLETAGVRATRTVSGAPALSKASQNRLREMLEIVSCITGWAGGGQPALAWYRAQPLPAFGSRTAEALVKEGKAAAVRDYLDHIAVGGFA